MKMKKRNGAYYVALKKMMIKYWGKQDKICDMCAGYKMNQHLYLDDKKTVRGLFPEFDWVNQLICTSCAKREVGKKEWGRVSQG